MDNLTTLKESKDWLRERLDDGAKCPCCSQFAKMYKRRLYSTMAKILIAFYKIEEGDYMHVTDMIRKTGIPDYMGGDWAKLKYWGLIDSKDLDENDDKKNSGYWEITDEGRLFVERRINVKSHIKLYDGRFFGFDGENVFIDECLGKKFSYDELMNG